MQIENIMLKKENNELRQQIETFYKKQNNSTFENIEKDIENLSIFRKKNFIEEEEFNSFNNGEFGMFWKESAEEIDFDKLENNNKLIQNTKRKEIEKKLELLFAYNSPLEDSNKDCFVSYLKENT